MALAEGSYLGPYEILAPLGAGGMGEVYRARDKRLGRDVALKVLPEAVSHDPERLARFDREARVLAALSHPNILDIHDVGSQGETGYIVAELLDGETLRNLLGRRRLRNREAVGYAVQIARGLAAAHEKGIVHRDLKPANLLVTKDGTVKILDFGLAKVVRPQPPSDRTEETATAEPETADRAVLGTVDYMSPEQVRGLAVDHRSDIFSFGTVLYEMLAGERPFRGDSAADTASAILKEDPPQFSGESPDVPTGLERIVLRCLAKEPESRFQSARDLVFDLEAGPEAGSPRKRRRAWWLAAATVVAAVALTTGYLWLRSRNEAPKPPSPAAARRPMLVVLPFENLGPPEDAYFATGMTDEIMSRLARVSGLGVISRTSAFQYERKGKTMKQIGSDLGVGFVLEGSVRWERRGDQPGRVRISPRLIRVADDTHLWAQSYDRALGGVFDTQSEIATAVVNQLGVTLLAHERQGVAVRPPENLDAYQAYLRGQELLNTPDYPREAMELGIQMFQRAVELDPGFAAAYAALSRANCLFAAIYDPTPARRAKALEAARRALELDPASPEGRKALGLYYDVVLHDQKRALDELTRAAELLPNDAGLASWIGRVLWREGRIGEASAQFEKAVELDPRNPDAVTALGLFCRASRRYAESARYHGLLIALQPDTLEWYMAQSALYLDWGRPKEAREVLERAPRTDERHLLWAWWYLEYWTGNHQAALERLAAAPEVLEFGWGKYPRALLESMTYDAMNQPRRARAAWAASLRVVERILKKTPEDDAVRGLLGVIYAGLGRKEDAIREAKSAVEREQKTVGASAATRGVWGLAVVYAQVGEAELALDQLELLLSVPSGVSYGRLLYDPEVRALRGHPRFEKLLAEAKKPLPLPPS